MKLPSESNVPFKKCLENRCPSDFLFCSLIIIIIIIRDANIKIQKKGRIQTKIGRSSKLHANSMAQTLPEIGRLSNLGIKMDKNVYKNREPPSEIGRIGISVLLSI